MNEGTLSKVIGERARQLRTRAGATQDQVAIEARKLGLPWTSGRIRKIETGENTLTVDSLLVLATILAELSTEPITLATLVDDGELEEVTILGRSGQLHKNVSEFPLAQHFWTNSVEVANWFKGGELAPKPSPNRSIEEEFDYPSDRLFRLIGIAEQGPAGSWLEQQHEGMAQHRFKEAVQRSGPAEQRAARSLDVDLIELAAHSTSLWGSELSRERDSRAAQWERETGKVASKQKRGQITRELLSELQTAVNLERNHMADKEVARQAEEARLRQDMAAQEKSEGRT